MLESFKFENRGRYPDDLPLDIELARLYSVSMQLPLTDEPDEPVLDFLGREVHKDDYIVTAFGLGSHGVEQRLGQIVGFTGRTDDVEFRTARIERQIEVIWFTNNMGWKSATKSSRIFTDLKRYAVVEKPAHIPDYAAELSID